MAHSINYRRIYEKPLSQRLQRERDGKRLTRSRAMNGFAGLHHAKKQIQGIFVSGKVFQSLKAECEGPVVGPVALIVEISKEYQPNFPLKARLSPYFKKSL